jgi:hypothetical protein
MPLAITNIGTIVSGDWRAALVHPGDEHRVLELPSPAGTGNDTKTGRVQ